MSELLRFVLEEPAGATRISQPVGFGLPLPEGLIDDPERIIVSVPGEPPLVLQSEVLGRHRDGSLRWVFLQFVTSLAAQERKELRVELCSEHRAPHESPLLLQEDEGTIHIETGAIAFELPKRGFALPKDLMLEGTVPLAFQDTWGFKAIDGDGLEFYTGLDEQTQVKVLERGPIRALVHFNGKHCRQEGSRWLDYDVWLSCYARSPVLTLQYRVLSLENLERPEDRPLHANVRERVTTAIREVSLEARLSLGPSPQLLMGGNDSRYETFLAIEESARLEQQASRYTIEGTRGESLSRFWALGWADIADQTAGLGVAAEDFAQNHPKGITLDRSGIQVDLYPASAEPLQLARGSGKTHILHLRCHRQEDPQDALAGALSTLEPPTVILPPEWYALSGVLGEIFTPRPKEHPRFEIGLREAFEPGRYGSGLTGILDFGDHGDANYKNNNEYDLNHSYFVLFARSGGRNYLKAAMRGALHTMDQDFAHYATAHLDDGGLYIHCGDHNDSRVDLDHLWAQGLLERYFFLGDREALRIARRLGENAILQVTKSEFRRATERAVGWPLSLLCSLYEATRDEKFLTGANIAVETALDWQDLELGNWPHVLNEEPLFRGGCSFMTGVLLDALAHYYDLTGEERVKESFLRGVNWLLERERFPDGMFWWKDSPRLRFPTSDVLVFPAFAHAYWLTGDQKYLEAMVIPFQMRGMPRKGGAQGDGMYLRSIFELAAALDNAGMLAGLVP